MGSSNPSVLPSYRFMPKVQDLVPLPGQTGCAEGDTVSTTHSTAGHLLAALDVDGDGAASRRDMLLAFRRDRQLAGAAGRQLHLGGAVVPPVGGPEVQQHRIY